jgi:hypothetical protein
MAKAEAARPAAAKKAEARIKDNSCGEKRDPASLAGRMRKEPFFRVKGAEVMQQMLPVSNRKSVNSRGAP